MHVLLISYDYAEVLLTGLFADAYLDAAIYLCQFCDPFLSSSFWKFDFLSLWLYRRWLPCCWHWWCRDKAETCLWNRYSWYNWHWPGMRSLAMCTVFCYPVQWLNGFRSSWQVAMSVNDIVTSGARPLYFQDYYFTSKLDVELAEKALIQFSAHLNIFFTCSF